MTIAVVDDLYEDREKLKKVLEDYAVANGLTDFMISCFQSGEELLEKYRPMMYTVIFLDIFMDGMTGIETAEKIRELDEETILVFLTTSDDSQRAAIHWHVYDYLSKDEGSEAIRRVMDRILRHHTRAATKRFSFSWERRNWALSYADIVSIQAHGNNLSIKDQSGMEYRPRMIYRVAKEVLLLDKRFLEITRGVIVNMDYITDITNSVCYMKDDVCLPISIKNRKTITQIWLNYLFAQARTEGGFEDD